eukprot:COSAG01_NODE_17178_length_1172_cov_30.905871_1_plen_50_part_10
MLENAQKCIDGPGHHSTDGMYLSWHAAASALRTKSDCSLQKNCSECVTAP